MLSWLFGTSKKNLTTFGTTVAKLRVTKKKNLYKMCKFLDLHPKTVAKIEKGRVRLPDGYEDKLIRFFALAGEEANNFRKLAENERKRWT